MTIMDYTGTSYALREWAKQRLGVEGAVGVSIVWRTVVIPADAMHAHGCCEWLTER